MSVPSASPVPLGQSIREYRPSPTDLALMLGIAVVCIVLFIVVDPVITIGNIEWDFNIWLKSLLAIVILWCGFGFYARRGLSYVLYEGGFTRTLMSNTLTVRWSDIKHVNVAVKQEMLTGSIPVPGTKAQEFKITLKSGKVITFQGNSLRDGREFGEAVTRRWQDAVKVAAAANKPAASLPPEG